MHVMIIDITITIPAVIKITVRNIRITVIIICMSVVRVLLDHKLMITITAAYYWWCEYYHHYEYAPQY